MRSMTAGCVSWVALVALGVGCGNSSTDAPSGTGGKGNGGQRAAAGGGGASGGGSFTDGGTSSESSGSTSGRGGGIQLGGGTSGKDGGIRIPRCGDGVREGGERCDDGNAIDGDGCDAGCTICGDGIVEGNEECDGETAACSKCRSTAPKPSEKLYFPGASLRHPSGRFYGFNDATAYAVKVFMPDLEAWDTLWGIINEELSVSVWATSKLFPLSDGGVLSSVNVGTRKLDVHLARYTENGELRWAVRLQNPGDNRYVSAADNDASGIVVAGLEHTGRGGTGNTALISVIDPDGVEGVPINFAFNGLETWPNAVRFVSNGRICSGGAQWSAVDEQNRAGWVACFDADGKTLWQRSLDAPALGLRVVDDETLDVLTSTAWTKVMLDDGTLGERRAITMPKLEYPEVALSGGNALVVGSVDANESTWAGVIDEGGVVRWSITSPGQGIPVGLAPDGTAFISTSSSSGYLLGYGTGAESDAEEPPALSPSTFSVAKSETSPACPGFCDKIVMAECMNVHGQAVETRYECLTACVRPNPCQAEFEAFRACIAERGSLMCAGDTFVPSGCDQEYETLRSCPVQ